jgi:hypothetical protein
LATPEDNAGVGKALAVAGRTYAAELPKKPASEVRRFLLAVASRVIVAEERVEIMLSRRALRSTLLDSLPRQGPGRQATVALRYDDEDVLHLHIDARIRRCGSEIRLVLPPGSGDERPARRDESLIKAVARGHVWYEKLISGEVDSLRTIAKEHGVHARYVGRIFRCAFLAPDIVETILEGRQPPQLTVEKLRFGAPLLWTDQRKLFGLSPN